MLAVSTYMYPTAPDVGNTERRKFQFYVMIAELILYLKLLSVLGGAFNFNTILSSSG